MNVQLLRDELQHVLSGKSSVRFGRTIQSISGHLGNGQGTSEAIEDQKLLKKQEEERLIEFIIANNLWLNDIDFSQYVSEGAEQRVYLKDNRHVIKLNDGIYYRCWQEYFQNILLHNYFFTDTAYELLGFVDDANRLYCVVQQNFVSTNEVTDIGHVKSFMSTNGFTNNRNNDYIHDDLGIIIEDLHDENVLTKNEVLYFIDTVFYTTNKFWNISK
jgi:hypothetical protein